MKTAISIPDEVFRRAERYAKKLGVSRSELFTQAMQAFLDQEQFRDVTASYDRAFGSESGKDDLELLLQRAARRALLDVEW